MPTAPDDYSQAADTGELAVATVLDFPKIEAEPDAPADGAQLALAAQAAVDQRYIEWRVLRVAAQTWALYVATILMVIAAITIGAVGVKILTSWH